ncbi:hypothetical protein KKF38_03360 [Patescibacteria group bacterium]|nr:hypothetical protein [Patescibacteria group bacterium]
MGTCKVEFRFQGKPEKTVMVDTDKLPFWNNNNDVWNNNNDPILKTALLGVSKKNRSRITEVLMEGKNIPVESLKFQNALSTLKEGRVGTTKYHQMKTIGNSYL